MDFSVDRSSEIPLGTQLAWKLQAAVAAGTLSPGQRLPALRQLAEEAGVNVNTVRAVYSRLEDQGLIASEQGRGTFVTEHAGGSATLGRLAAQAAAEARNAGLDPRDVATALYAGSRVPAVEADEGTASEPVTGSDEREYRAELRRQIAEYERQVTYYTRHHVGAQAEGETKRPTAGALLSASELEAIRDELHERVTELRRDEEQTRDEESELRQLERTVQDLRRQEDIRRSSRTSGASTSGPPRIVWQHGPQRWKA